MNSTNLLPCPFCGQRDIPIKNENPGDLSGGYFIECPDCGASTCIRYACGDDPRPLLAATWNRRTPGQCLHQISEPAAVAPQGVEPSALTKSIRELDDWEDRADDEVLTPSECESVMLVLHELKRLRSQPAAVAGPSEADIDSMIRDFGPKQGIQKDSRDLSMNKLRALIRCAVATWGSALQPPVQAQEPVAWIHEDDPDRCISAAQKAAAMRDGGASASSVRPYSIPAYARPAPTGWKLVPITVPRSAFPWVSGGYSADYKASNPRDQRVIVDRAQRTWQNILDGISSPAPALEAPGDVVRTFRDYISVHEVSGRMNGRAMDDMALDLARIAVNFKHLVKDTAPQVPAARLTKPARVGGGTFGTGVQERHVIEAAQRHYELEGQRETRTPEQRADEERQRRALWDMVNGPLAAAPQPTDWQPIQTAPKNGRSLLLGYINSLGKWRTVRGQWMDQTFIDEYAEDPDQMSPGWYETTVEDDEGKCWPIEPTRWQPLPTPPQGFSNDQ